jgi:tripeptide aminopeptidase
MRSWDTGCLLDLDALGAAYGYTIVAGPLGEFCCRTLNAAQVQVSAYGKAVHTGTAKGLTIDASEALMEFRAIILPPEQPEYTGGYEGFYYLERMEGTCEEAHTTYIIQDHEQSLVENARSSCRGQLSP